MKIIQCDNFDRDHVPDKLIAENVPEEYAGVMCDALREEFSSGPNPMDWFRVVPDDYELKQQEC